MRVFEALTEAYDSRRARAPIATPSKLTPALKFELPVTVVVLPQGTSASARLQISATSRASTVRSWFTSRLARKAGAGCSAGLRRSERSALNAATDQITPQSAAPMATHAGSI
jgi:hypothetical protein